jgi:hypothetical protein
MWRRIDVVLNDVSEERLLAAAFTVSSLEDFLIFSFYPEDG